MLGVYSLRSCTPDTFGLPSMKQDQVHETLNWLIPQMSVFFFFLKEEVLELGQDTHIHCEIITMMAFIKHQPWEVNLGLVIH